MKKVILGLLIFLVSKLALALYYCPKEVYCKYADVNSCNTVGKGINSFDGRGTAGNVFAGRYKLIEVYSQSKIVDEKFISRGYAVCRYAPTFQSSFSQVTFLVNDKYEAYTEGLSLWQIIEKEHAARCYNPFNLEPEHCPLQLASQYKV